jgi:hypothetical protein
MPYFPFLRGFFEEVGSSMGSSRKLGRPEGPKRGLVFDDLSWNRLSSNVRAAVAEPKPLV